jgi:hypothetical protein
MIKVSEPQEEFFNTCLNKDDVHTQSGISWKDVTEDGTESYLISDEHGPLMTVRLHNALRVAIQFDPDAKYRSAKAAKEVVAWFSDIAKKRGAKEVIIRPGGGAVPFSERLGFRDFIGKFIPI